MLAPATAKAAAQDDLFSEGVPLLLPARLAVEGKVMGMGRSGWAFAAELRGYPQCRSWPQ
jgi:hypothetical protein